jgi:hypothetical protein
MKPLLKSAFALTIFAFAPAADCDGGLRNTADGECPAGDVCDGSTPTGLEFVAPVIDEGFFDTGEVKTMALGGTQTIQLDTDDGGSDNLTPFTLPYVASFDSTELTVASTSGNTVVVRAGSAVESDTSLRITRPGDGALYDRIFVETRAISTATFALTLAQAFDSEGSDQTLDLFAPGGTGYLRMSASDQTALIDDSAVIGGLGVSQHKWDEFTVGDVAVGSYAVTLDAGSRLFSIGYQVAAGPDSVQIVEGAGQLGAGENLVCFAAFLGTRFIHVPWTFTAEHATVAPSAFDGCEEVTPTSLGQVILHVHAGTLAVDESFDAISTQVAHRTPSARVGSLGDRAAALR